MDIQVTVKSCNITENGNGEGIIEFNNRDFKYVILPPAGERKKYDITIKDIDIENLNKAGFELNFQPLIENYTTAIGVHKETKQQEKTQKRERVFILSKLHELKPALGKNFSMMPEKEYVNSKSAALFAIYCETYKNHTKELTVFMDKDHFIVYDNLNRKAISEPAITPEHVKEILDEEIEKWKHKVDFKLLLLAHADEDSQKTDIEPISASEYFQKLQIEEKTHEKEIIENHIKYLKELGKLGEQAEMKAYESDHVNNTDTSTIHKKKILGSLSKEHLETIKHPFSADDL
jgi:hypothetical protein